MTTRCYISTGAAFLLCTTMLSCGTAPPRTLQSISVSAQAVGPGVAPVQFTATDHWNTSPQITAPLAPRWGVCKGDEATTAVTVTSTGSATCGKGAQGTYTIYVQDPGASSGPVCNVVNACGRGCQIDGSAELGCP